MKTPWGPTRGHHRLNMAKIDQKALIFSILLPPVNSGNKCSLFYTDLMPGGSKKWLTIVRTPGVSTRVSKRSSQRSKKDQNWSLGMLRPARIKVKLLWKFGDRLFWLIFGWGIQWWYQKRRFRMISQPYRALNEHNYHFLAFSAIFYNNKQFFPAIFLYRPQDSWVKHRCTHLKCLPCPI